MKVRSLISRIAATLFLLGSAGALSAQTTATDTIGVGYDVSGKVLMIGIYGGNRVSLRIYGGIGASEAGERATQGGGAVSYTAGGRLRYTLYLEATSKITVHTTISNYNDGALSVMALGIGTGGSGNAGNIQGSPTSPGRLGYIPIKYNLPMDYITGISGSNTWTGTTRLDGSQVKYRLNAHPGGISGGSVPVVYTILNS
ncbi:MAG: hypothetical protein WCL50_00175 [Spirochaetota bacterium]